MDYTAFAIEERITNLVINAARSLDKARELADRNDVRLLDSGSYIPKVYGTSAVTEADKVVEELAFALHDAQYEHDEIENLERQFAAQ